MVATESRRDGLSRAGDDVSECHEVMTVRATISAGLIVVAGVLTWAAARRRLLAHAVLVVALAAVASVATLIMNESVRSGGAL